MSKIHLINKQGDRIAVENSEWMDSKLLTENKCSNYYIDDDWYVSHGYIEINEAIQIIEGNNG
jgi:hypothetical protein